MLGKRKSWTQQIVTIENKGYAAFFAGVPADNNPYKKSGNQSGTGGSVQKQRRAAWSRGWRLGESEAEDKKTKDSQ